MISTTSFVDADQESDSASRQFLVSLWLTPAPVDADEPLAVNRCRANRSDAWSRDGGVIVAGVHAGVAGSVALNSPPNR